MSTDCSALPSPWSSRAPRFGWRATVAGWQRWVRLIRVCGLLLRMWLAARLLGPRLSERWREPVVRHFSERMLSILGIRVAVRGTVPALAWPVLMVANHVSWLDTYVVNAFHGARFVAKSEVASWPIIGTIARRFGTLFIIRNRRRPAARTKDEMATYLRRGIPVAVFPEGTTTDGRTVRCFFPALLQSAVDAGVAVQPVAIAYRTRDGRPCTAAAFIDDLSVFTSLRQILQAGEVVAEVTFCQPLSSRGQTRAEIARRTRRSIADVLEIPSVMLEPERPARTARPLPAPPTLVTAAPASTRGRDRWQRAWNAVRLPHGSLAGG